MDHNEHFYVAQVTDSDLNSATSVDTVNISMTVLNGTSAVTSSYLTLKEISTSSSLFTGILLLCRSCSTNGYLSVGSSRNRTVCATYADLSHQMSSCSSSCDSTGHCVYNCQKSTASRTSCSRVSVSGLLSMQPFISNASTLSISLDDADLNTADSIQTTNLTVISYQSTSQSANQTVMLTETGTDTGLFTGTFSLNRVAAVTGCTFSSSGICCGLGAAAKVRVVYADLNPPLQVISDQPMVCIGTFAVSSYFVTGNNLQVSRLSYLWFFLKLLNLFCINGAYPRN